MHRVLKIKFRNGSTYEIINNYEIDKWKLLKIAKSQRYDIW